jgi:hypothetical protein
MSTFGFSDLTWGTHFGGDDDEQDEEQDYSSQVSMQFPFYNLGYAVRGYRGCKQPSYNVLFEEKNL